ncbi:MAG: hypothetical protein ISR61_03625 [Desulfobacteraceae bacterium]|uniref:Uncharacterized protein n=1 Tax=Candidatus Desulfacyla euxinica TaxID=2841693 RepID=A0A8J6MZU9_9DELT|nr:hypothetical protein [Candidatus Desulfacyla euxinica]MBL6978013.1 hypothetical protein [Desulfobacteraceae bacterium]
MIALKHEGSGFTQVGEINGVPIEGAAYPGNFSPGKHKIPLRRNQGE